MSSDTYFETSHKKGDVLRALHASKCAYAESPAAFCVQRDETTKLGLFDEVVQCGADCKSPHVVAFDSKSRLMVVAFRGTDFSKREDVVCNLNIAERDGQHAGFSYRAEGANLSALLGSAAERSVVTLLFTGHSLGGGAAICAAVWALSEKFFGAPAMSNVRVSCITFAAPYALTFTKAEFVALRLRATSAFLNVVNENDIVPHLLSVLDAEAVKPIVRVIQVAIDSTQVGLPLAFMGAVISEINQRMLRTHQWSRVGATAWLRFDNAASRVSVSVTTSGVQDGWQQLFNDSLSSLKLGLIYKFHRLVHHELQLRSAGGGLDGLVLRPPPEAAVAPVVVKTAATATTVAVSENVVAQHGALVAPTSSSILKFGRLKSPNIFFSLLPQGRVILVEIEHHDKRGVDLVHSFGASASVLSETGTIRTIWLTFTDYDGTVHRVKLHETYFVESRHKKGPHLLWQHSSKPLNDQLLSFAREHLVAMPSNANVLLPHRAKL
jgi:hypothetical protein